MTRRTDGKTGIKFTAGNVQATTGGGGFNGVAEVKNTTNEIEISLLPLRKKNQKLIKSNIFSVFSNEFDTIYGNRLQKIVFNVFNEFKLIESEQLHV